MYILYWTLACILSILFFAYCVNTDRFNWATLFSIILIISSVISITNGLMLFCNRSNTENKQAELEELKTQIDFLLAIKEDNETNISYQNLLINTLDKYNKKVNYCRKEQESKMYSDFMNWDFCYNYELIEYSVTVKDITIK